MKRICSFSLNFYLSVYASRRESRLRQFSQDFLRMKFNACFWTHIFLCFETRTRNHIKLKSTRKVKREKMLPILTRISGVKNSRWSLSQTTQIIQISAICGKIQRIKKYSRFPQYCKGDKRLFNKFYERNTNSSFP